MIRFLIVSILALQAPLALAQDGSGAAGASSVAEPRLILVSAGGGDSPLETMATDLMGAALELGEGYQLTEDEDEAAWKVEVTVNGDGPWRLRVLAIPMNEMGERIPAKGSFRDRGDLAGAIDRSVTKLHGVWNEAAGDAPGIAPYLSGSEEAAGRFLEGLHAIRAGRFSQADGLLLGALEADPGFDLAAGELIALRSTGEAGAGIEFREEDGAPALPAIPERILEDRRLVLASILRGISLSRGDRREEAVEPLKSAASSRPRDPRGRYWLGVALMAAGDMEGAASSFSRARESWPGLLRAYSLGAEAHVRVREIEEAREVLVAMDEVMESMGVVSVESALHPGLMLGSLELLSGRLGGALDAYEAEALEMQEGGHHGEALHVLRTTIADMRRDLVREEDWTRERRLEDAWEAVREYKEAIPDAVLASRPWEVLRLEGLNYLKEGNTVEAWKLIEEIKNHSGMPGYDDYYEAYLTAATMLKEGDLEGCAEQFKRAEAARSRICDLMDVVMTQKQLNNLAEARRGLEEFERGLSRYDPSSPDHDDMILTDPHLAALVPMYHYVRARLAFETGRPNESRNHFSYMLGYLQEPDDNLVPLVKEAYGRGATPK